MSPMRGFMAELVARVLMHSLLSVFSHKVCRERWRIGAKIRREIYSPRSRECPVMKSRPVSRSVP